MQVARSAILGLLPRVSFIAGAETPCAALISLRAWSSLAELDLDNAFGEYDKKDQQYVDRLKVTARAGDGGNGCVSFWKSAAKGKHVPADGGNGAAGGSVILRASSNMKSLAGVQQLYRAERGGHGSKQKQAGRAGRDTVVLVPLGTVVSRLREPPPGNADAAVAQSDAEPEPAWLQSWLTPWVGADEAHSSGSHAPGADDGGGGSPSVAGAAAHSSAAAGSEGEREEASEYEFVADLVRHGEEAVVAAGGAGGQGNAAKRALPRRPAPATADKGHPGQVSRLLLELKLLADVALVGLPNAGKSSLLRALSAATPKVAGYSFTTLSPQLGAVRLGEESTVVVADVPGLIEGAHANRGLGHRFLRHVERCRALAFVVDAAGGSGAPGASTRLRPWEQLALLRAEIGHYSPALLHRPWVVVANKVDLLPRAGATLEALRRRCGTGSAGAGGGGASADGEDIPAAAAVVGVSATGRGSGPEGLPALLEALHAVVEAGAEVER